MHRLIGRAAVLTATLLALCATPARADSGWGEVNCDATPTTPECTVTVVDPADTEEPDDDEPAGPLTCRFGDEEIDCYSEGFGWYGGDGCYYGKDENAFLPDREWIKRCLDPTTGDVTEEGTVLLRDQPAALTALAARAVARLRLPRPRIAASPPLDAPQVVHVPVWWWIEPQVWRVRTATASLPGITLTARATPVHVTWDAGDGTRTVCAGPGSRWTRERPAGAASPTCGHTYANGSRNSPGGRFTVQATVAWDVTWTSSGLRGSEPSITTSVTAAVQVSEVRAVVVAS